MTKQNRLFGSSALLMLMVMPALCLADTPVLTVNSGDLTSGDRSFQRQFDQNFFDEYWRMFPERAITAGYFKYADKLSLLNDSTRARMLGSLNKWISLLHRFDPATLSETSRSDWQMLKAEFDKQRSMLTEERSWTMNPAMYDVSEGCARIMAADYAPLEQRLRAFLKRLDYITEYYRLAKTNLLAPTPELTRLALQQNQAALEIFGPSLEQTIEKSQLRDSERAMFKRRLTVARAAVEDYTLWLQAQYPQETAAPLQHTVAANGYPSAATATVEALYKRTLVESAQ